MSDAAVAERPLVFSCEGDDMLGIVHAPAGHASLGLLIVIAGGPQYRAGVGRGMVSMARRLASEGIAVMRFDHRGLGDSAGTFRGFENYAPDLQAAVDAFLREVPGLDGVVVWGGCDAASGIMIHGHALRGVTALGLGNPWVYIPEIQEAVIQQHYRERLLQWSFWRKLLRFEYNLADYIRGALRKVGRKLTGLFSSADAEQGGGGGTFVDRMLAGFTHFEGPVLFVISGASMASREFDELIQRDAAWSTVYGRDNCRRIDFPEADQTFSDAASRESLNAALVEWLRELCSARD
ncbi:MAG: hydrolase 1, exosortase A system-associated [Halioglobus sp.]|nr:hydrolase 1, exosortase A system-associated [Halioglobus sp.]